MKSIVTKLISMSESEYQSLSVLLRFGNNTHRSNNCRKNNRLVDEHYKISRVDIDCVEQGTSTRNIIISQVLNYEWIHVYSYMRQCRHILHIIQSTNSFAIPAHRILITVLSILKLHYIFIMFLIFKLPIIFIMPL